MVALDSLIFAVVAGAVAALPSLFVLLRVRRLEDLSYRDYQTGLRSGRLYEDDAALLCRSLCSVAVLLIDLDHFRRFNERGYREDGDRALLTAAQVLKEHLQRSADRVYRMHTAGDEFVVLFTVESFDEAYQQAERLRLMLERAAVPASVGIAFAEPSSNRSPAQLLRLATTNKDVAKKRGRNSVFPRNDPPPPPAPVAIVPSPAGPVLLPAWTDEAA